MSAHAVVFVIANLAQMDAERTDSVMKCTTSFPGCNAEWAKLEVFSIMRSVRSCAHIMQCSRQMSGRQRKRKESGAGNRFGGVLYQK